MPLIVSLLHLKVELRGLCQVPPFCSCCLPRPFDRAPPSIPNLTFFQFNSTLAASLIAHWGVETCVDCVCDRLVLW